MKAICFNFEIHQPFRLKRYRFFDIGRDHWYFDDFLNDDIVTRVAHNSYIPAAETLLRMIENGGGRFKCSIAISGVAFEQIEHYVPELIDILKKLADTGCVEFVAQPFAYSLASLADPEEFAAQVADTSSILQSRFGVKPKVLRNTELIYDDDLAPQLVEMGFKGVLTEGAKHILGWKSPNYIYTAATAPKLKLLLRNAKLSDDIAFRFSDTSWSEYPLTADKYISWIAATPQEEQIVNIFLNMETFGDLHPATTGIFQFLEALPRYAAEAGIDFVTPSEAIAKIKPVSELSVMHPISSSDEARDTTAWLGNRLQNEAFEKLYAAGERVRQCNNRSLKRDWQYLQSCDHFFYMSPRSNGFSPYENQFAAFTNYMNVLADFLMRVEEEFPSQVDSEELNSLLMTISNQDAEIEALNKELRAMRKNVEQYNIEHRPLAEREAVAEEAPATEKKARKAPAKKATAAKAGTGKAVAEKAAAGKAATAEKAAAKKPRKAAAKKDKE